MIDSLLEVFPGDSAVKTLSMQETREMWVQSLGQEDPLEKEMGTHSSVLAWRLPGTGGAWWATGHRASELATTE